ncbi:MAG: VWA domain-containing protein [Rhodospirillaceae bacterium]|nr:VWA domain-containing protein [Rhodospirillaceae bacterium]
MFLNLLDGMKRAGLPVSITEYLTLVEATEANLADYNVEDFYYLARTIMVKDERLLDRFDRVFAEVFKGLEGSASVESIAANIPAEWLKMLSELNLSDEDKEKIKALGGWDKLMETLKQRLAEQKDRHQGGNKWIGTGGRSPFGAYGYNPEGVRIGQDESRHRRAVKVWDKREFKNLDDDVEIGTRNIKMALRRLRRFAREGAPTELDIDGTISATARQGGWLDLQMVPERHNAVKVLLFLDAGGSMDDHVKVCAELFSAARNEFKHLEYYYFHNCLYEGVWKDNRRRHDQKISTFQLMRTYAADYKLIFVGDASMSPYEIVHPGAAVEHWNEESGETWMRRVLDTWPKSVWLNPLPQKHWRYTESISMIRSLMDDRMYPLTLGGLDAAMAELKR